MTTELVENADFLHEVPDSVVKVAFAAETQNVIENAKRKPRTHGHLDLICANDVSAPDSGFGTDTNRVSIIDAGGRRSKSCPCCRSTRSRSASSTASCR